MGTTTGHLRRRTRKNVMSVVLSVLGQVGEEQDQGEDGKRCHARTFLTGPSDISASIISPNVPGSFRYSHCMPFPASSTGIRQPDGSPASMPGSCCPLPLYSFIARSFLPCYRKSLMALAKAVLASLYSGLSLPNSCFFCQAIASHFSARACLARLSVMGG